LHIVEIANSTNWHQVNLNELSGPHRVLQPLPTTNSAAIAVAGCFADRQLSNCVGYLELLPEPGRAAASAEREPGPCRKQAACLRAGNFTELGTAGGRPVQQRYGLTPSMVCQVQVCLHTHAPGPPEAAAADVVQSIKLPEAKLMGPVRTDCSSNLAELARAELGAARTVMKQTDRCCLHEAVSAGPLRAPARMFWPGLTSIRARPTRTATSKEKRPARALPRPWLVKCQLCRRLALLPPARPGSEMAAAPGPAAARHGYRLCSRGKAGGSRERGRTLSDHAERTIRLGQKSHVEVAKFSPDGQFLVTGQRGRIHRILWNFITGKIRKDLKPRSFHDDGRSSFSPGFSRDSEMLCSGAQDGKMKVWKIQTGQCLRRFERAHTQGVTCVQFSKDNTHIVSASFDCSVRIHGLKSGKCLKEFLGHTSFVNDVAFSLDGHQIISASSDGTVRVWVSKTQECAPSASNPPWLERRFLCSRFTFCPRHQTILWCATKPTRALISATPISITLISTTLISALISANLISATLISATPISITLISITLISVTQTEATSIFVPITGGNNQHARPGSAQLLVRQTRGGDFICATVSPRGEWIYCCGEDKTLYCFSVQSGKLERTLAIISEREIIGVAPPAPTRT
uniref:WD_REPEATS_REGION domain-containing protein n=1 Tax=Macrostomum lignano TaxID=282301 RepID=A0A1I8JNX4_9PLAT